MAEIELGNDWTVVGEDGGEFIIEDDQGNRTKIDNNGNVNASALTTDVVVSQSNGADGIVWEDNGTYRGISRTDQYSDSDNASDVLSSVNSDVPAGGSVLIKGGTVVTRQPVLLNSNKRYRIEGTVKTHDGVSSDLSSDVTGPTDTIPVVDGSKFQVGDWVAITDDTEPVDKRSQAAEFAIVSATASGSVTLDRDIQKSYTTADNGFLATANTPLHADGESNLSIEGSGEIDGNRTNQSKIRPILPGTSDEVESSLACLALDNCTDVSIGGGLTVRNAGLHNLSISFSNNFVVSELISDGAFHKSVLLFKCDHGVLNSILSFDAVEEDGIISYSGTNSEITISDVIVFNNGRHGCFSRGNDITMSSVQSYGNAEDGVLVQSAGDRSVLSDIISNNNGSVGIRSSSSRTALTLSGAIVDSNGSDGVNVGTADSQVGNIYAKNNGNDGVRVEADHCQVGNIYADSNSSDGVRLNQAVGVTLSGVYAVTNTTGVNIATNTQTDGYHEVSNIIAEDNTNFGLSVVRYDHVSVSNAIGLSNDNRGITTAVCEDVTFTNCSALNNVNEGFKLGGTGVNLANPYLAQGNGTDILRGGARVVVGGMGRNAGDPSATGDWNGNGYEGVMVRDTSNSNTYIYNNGAWSQIAST